MENNKIIPKQKEHLERLRLFHIGKKRTEETKKNISKSLKGKCTGIKRPEHSLWMKNNHPKGMLGKKHTQETKEKMSKSLSYEKIITLERNIKISKALKGEKHWNWKGGLTIPKYIKLQIRKSREYIFWRKEVFKRDNYTCRNCGVVGGKLEVHHIKSFAFFPESRFEVLNGICLCKECHKKENIKQMRGNKNGRKITN